MTRLFFWSPPRCRPARCGTMTSAPMRAAITAEASGRLRLRPPWLTGLSRNRAQRVRESDCGPIECLDFRSRNRIRWHRSPATNTKAQSEEHTRQQHSRSACVADPERAIREVGHRRAEGRRGDDRRPAEKWPEAVDPNLGQNKRHQPDAELHDADEIPQFSVIVTVSPPGLAERRRQHLDDLEAQGDFGHLAQRELRLVSHGERRLVNAW
jgi:hypothetical protein